MSLVLMRPKDKDKIISKDGNGKRTQGNGWCAKQGNEAWPIQKKGEPYFKHKVDLGVVCGSAQNERPYP
jgi:hypothetical protein